MLIPFTPFLQLINGTIALWAGFRFLRSYRKTGNIFSRIFIHTGFGIALSYYLYALPVLLAPERGYLHGVFYLLSFFPLFWGLSQALRFAFQIWGYRLLEKVIVPVTLIFSVILFGTHLSAIPSSTIVGRVVVWNVAFPFDMIFSVFILLLVTPLVVLFFTTRVSGRKARLNKIFFGLALLLGGIGGVGTNLNETQIPLLFSFYLLEFIGFMFLALVFVFDSFIPDDKQAPTTTAEVAPADSSVND